jgi:CheY-like chemotaxis protein
MGARVLIADDNPDARLTLEALLDSEGFQVHAVGDGAEVLPALREFHPHAVVLDIKMPGLSGYEVARRIVGRYGAARPRLIALSGHCRQDADRAFAQGMGFDHHLAKPCDFRALLELLPAPS